MSGEDLAEALTGDLDAWLDALPDYQHELVAKMLDGSDPDEAAIAWLSTSGPAETAPYGGVRSGAVLFYEKLLEQLQILICSDDEGYQEERASLMRQARAGRAALVTGAAVVVSPILGASPVVIAPAIALTFAVLSKAGKAALCESLQSMINERRHEAENSAS